MHLLGAPERGPGGCDNMPVGIVRPWGEYFEAHASLFVCLKDKTCPHADGGPGRRRRLPLGSWRSRRAVPLAGPGPCLPWLLYGAPFEGGRPEPMLYRLVSRGSAPLCFVRSYLGTVTEDILYSWSAAPSRVIQASTF